MLATDDKESRQYRYVLVTAAYNEGALIELVISSVVAQTFLPEKWIIVSDGSTDSTEEIVESYSSRYPFIQLLRINETHARNFAAQVAAINRGVRALEGTDYDFIGNLDADITLDHDYFSRLVARFHVEPKLGLSGGAIYEECEGEFAYRTTNNLGSVAHGVQMFRRECFECLGGYRELPYGGPDWHAEVFMRMNGWQVRSHADLKAYHHRPTGTAGGVLKYRYKQGFMDYSLGVHPLFELVKCLTRVGERPVVFGATVRLCGFVCACSRREKRCVPMEFIRFLRNEQKGRLRLCHIPKFPGC